MNYIEEKIQSLKNKADGLYHNDKTSSEQKQIIKDMYSEIEKLKSALNGELESIEDFERDLY